VALLRLRVGGLCAIGLGTVIAALEINRPGTHPVTRYVIQTPKMPSSSSTSLPKMYKKKMLLDRCCLRDRTTAQHALQSTTQAPAASKRVAWPNRPVASSAAVGRVRHSCLECGARQRSHEQLSKLASLHACSASQRCSVRRVRSHPQALSHSSTRADSSPAGVAEGACKELEPLWVRVVEVERAHPRKPHDVIRHEQPQVQRQYGERTQRHIFSPSFAACNPAVTLGFSLSC
jgi:hypothetical protein